MSSKVSYDAILEFRGSGLPAPSGITDRYFVPVDVVDGYEVSKKPEPLRGVSGIGQTEMELQRFSVPWDITVGSDNFKLDLDFYGSFKIPKPFNFRFQIENKKADAPITVFYNIPSNLRQFAAFDDMELVISSPPKVGSVTIAPSTSEVVRIDGLFYLPEYLASAETRDFYFPGSMFTLGGVAWGVEIYSSTALRKLAES